MLFRFGARGLLTVGLVASIALAATDPVGDTLEGIEPPVDAVDVQLYWGPGELTCALAFYPIPPVDPFDLSIIIDLDLDQSPLTGRSSHIGDVWFEDVPPLGADYSMYLFGGNFVLLTRTIDGVEQEVAFVQGYSEWPVVSFSLPRTLFDESFSGNCIDYTVVTATWSGMSDRVPNTAQPLSACAPDFNNDGLIDDDDVAFLVACRTGPTILNNVPACAIADLDADGDIDQDDFGHFQRQRIH
jgi:hypothetical protein